MSKKSVRMSIVIVNYQTGELTMNLLAKLHQSRFGFDTKLDEIVVVDNGSRDGVVTEVKKKYPSVVTIQIEKNLGFSGGYNRGIAVSRGEYIVLLNSDVEPVSDKALLELISGREVRVAKLVLPDGQVQASVFKLPTLAGAVKEYLLGQHKQYSLYVGSENEIVEGGVMAVFAIPRAVWERVGELSEETFLYYEDIDYCRRLKLAGIPVRYVEKAVFLHKHGQASMQLGRADERLVKAAKWYHGRLQYYLITAVLWLGQRYKSLGLKFQNSSFKAESE